MNEWEAKARHLFTEMLTTTWETVGGDEMRWAVPNQRWAQWIDEIRSLLGDDAFERIVMRDWDMRC